MYVLSAAVMSRINRFVFDFARWIISVWAIFETPWALLCTAELVRLCLYFQLCNACSWHLSCTIQNSQKCWASYSLPRFFLPTQFFWIPRFPAFPYHSYPSTWLVAMIDYTNHQCYTATCSYIFLTLTQFMAAAYSTEQQPQFRIISVCCGYFFRFWCVLGGEERFFTPHWDRPIHRQRQRFIIWHQPSACQLRNASHWIASHYGDRLILIRSPLAWVLVVMIVTLVRV